MKIKHTKALLSIVIAIMFILNLCCITLATEQNKLEHEIEIVHDCEEKGETVFIEPTDLIDALSLDELENNKFLSRKYSVEESLHDVIYHCEDGNDVAYFFQYPVKYVDENGKTKDISTAITEKNENTRDIIRLPGCSVDLSGFEYASEENAIKIYYDNTTDGKSANIVAKKGEYTITLSPIINEKGMSETPFKGKLVEYKDRQDKTKKGEYAGIEYCGVFGENTAVVYNTTYTGFKETIRLDCKPETNRFSFRLNTSGLIPLINETGNIILCDKYNDNVIARIAQIYVYDSSAESKYTLKSNYEIYRKDLYSDEYIITLNIDENFLNDDTTTYPVYIDPTTDFVSSSSINDAPIYSGLPNAACGSNYFNCIGYVDSLYQMGSLMVKFPGLRDSTWFNSLDNSRINGVIYNAYKVGGGYNPNGNSSVNVYYYLGSVWDESTVTYSSANISSNSGNIIKNVPMNSNTRYMIDITTAAIAWKNGTQNYDKGLVIKNASTANNHNLECDIASVEYGCNVNSSVMPYITVVYNSGNISTAFTYLDEPAFDFARKYYETVDYTRIEHGATIYKYNNKYYYYNPHHGQPHSITISTSVPSGAVYIGYVKVCHTTNSFTSNEIYTANANGYHYFLLPPNKEMMEYDGQDHYLATYNQLTNIYSLTDEELLVLKRDLSYTWYHHFVNGECPDDPNCPDRIWPNPYY